MNPETQDISQLLASWQGGDRGALDRLATLVEDELKRIASGYLRSESSGHTLQTTALVNEVFLRFLDISQVSFSDRKHFFRLAARMMRRILVDHARKRRAEKRGGAAVKVPLDEMIQVPGMPDAGIEDLDLALQSLHSLAPRKSEIVELKFFGGLSYEEIADAIGCSVSTVKRDWGFARAWLHRELKRD